MSRPATPDRRIPDTLCHAIVENAFAATLVVSLDGTVSFANPAAVTLFGRDPSGLRIEELVPVAQRSLHLRHRERYSVAPGRRLMGSGHHLRALHADGREVPVEVGLTPWSDGEHAFVIATVRDRTQDEKLRLSEERLARAQQIAKIGSWELDLVTGDLTWSEEAFRVLGLEPRDEPLTTGDFLQAVADEDRERVRAELDAAIHGLRPYDTEFGVRHADGTMMTIHALGVLLRDADGEPVRLVGTRQDVTEERRLKLQLEVAQRMEALGRLAGGVAHDFNNLLAVIKGYAELVKVALPATEAELHSDVDELVAAADRGVGLVSQLLAFSSRQVMQPTTVDLVELVRAVEPMLRRLTPAHVDLHLDDACATGYVLADRVQLDQVVINLVVNAVEALPQGGRVTVSVSTRDAPTGDGPGAQVALAVGDTGTGIPADVLPHVFEPFFSTKDRGSGLGLATVSGIVEQLGGRIEVESTVGAGTTFTILLPSHGSGVDIVPAPGQGSGVARGHETILLVEDQDEVRAVSGRILRQLGYTVIEAEHGAHALALMQEVGPTVDLLVTDMTMPGLGGVDLVDRLARPELPVLFVSGYSSDSEMLRERLDATHGFLAKPFAAVDLARSVRDLLEGSSRRPGRSGGS